VLFGAAGAQAQRAAVKANIPFDFFVGKHSMPAGVYLFAADGSGLMSIRGEHDGMTVVVAGSRSAMDAGKGSKVVFDKFGSQYILHRVLSRSSQRLSMDLPGWRPPKWHNERAMLEKEQIFVEAE